jgi:hypothetical protein
MSPFEAPSNGLLRLRLSDPAGGCFQTKRAAGAAYFIIYLFRLRANTSPAFVNYKRLLSQDKGIASPSAQRSLRRCFQTKRAAIAAYFIIYSFLLHVYMSSAFVNYKRLLSQPFLFEREKGFEPSTLSLGS